MFFKTGGPKYIDTYRCVEKIHVSGKYDTGRIENQRRGGLSYPAVSYRVRLGYDRIVLCTTYRLVSCNNGQSQSS